MYCVLLVAVRSVDASALSVLALALGPPGDLRLTHACHYERRVREVGPSRVLVSTVAAVDCRAFLQRIDSLQVVVLGLPQLLLEHADPVLPVAITLVLLMRL